jgi:small subunit ribosomal protein S21
MLIVNIKNGNIEGALKEYKRKVQSTKQIEQLRERKEFVKKSVKNRLQREETIRKNQKNLGFL